MADIEAIRARTEAATEGPWSVDNDPGGDAGIVWIHDGGKPVPIAESWAPDYPQQGRDAEFIAHARRDIPDLLAMIDRVRELHRPHCDMCRYCASCSLGGLSVAFPCPTIRALGGDS